jgi:hypothetical protein
MIVINVICGAVLLIGIAAWIVVVSRHARDRWRRWQRWRHRWQPGR